VRRPNVEQDGRPVTWRYHAAKFAWRPLLECRAVTLPIQDNATLGCKVKVAPGRIPLADKSAQKCIDSVPAQEMAKHRAKCGWPPLSDIGAVTKPRHETRWNLLGSPKLTNRSQSLVGQYLPYGEDTWRTYCCLTSFFPIVDTCLSYEDIAQQSCAMVHKMAIFCVIFASCIFSEPRAEHFRPAF